jgi:hypothetical protein
VGPACAPRAVLGGTAWPRVSKGRLPTSTAPSASRTLLRHRRAPPLASSPTSAAVVAQQLRWVAAPLPSAEQSCNVVDAVMDYLDTLSSGCTSEGMAAVHHDELEAVVDGVDAEG